ncbi:MAG: glutathione S-transferase N-terminal domain-containing protein [Burkholderiales bacterium]|nr:glutathione S-transferase N-terminal domain-containing protein [Burkholderiales bacterium]
MFKLISATPSPYARKVRIALIEKGLPFELVTEVPWNSTTVTPKYNPLEKLPVLLTDEGEAVYESSYILEWLELKFPATPLLPRDVDGILAAKKLDVLCNGVCDAVVLTFFEKQRAGGGSPEWLARQRRKIDGGMREIANLIGKREWAVGNAFGLGDIAAGTAAGYLAVRFKDFPLRERHPELAAYADRLALRPSFASTVPVPQNITDKIV